VLLFALVQIKFSGSTWRSISEPAKDCIRQMLCPQPEQRPSASELLSHPWLAAVAPQTAIAPHIVHQLQLFAGLSRARRVMLGVAANSISGSEASMMVKHFLAFDRDFNGTLDYQELSLATKQVSIIN
jgi:calcium-dependent protein kinase